MNKKMLLTLYEYNYWATDRILAVAAQLDEEAFVMKLWAGVDSVRDTLLHTLAAEHIWRLRMQEQQFPTGLLDPAEFPTLASIEKLWDVERHKMWHFLGNLGKDDLQQVVAYRTTSGREMASVLGQVLHHVVLHGMQHRAELAAMLTEYGRSPGDIDFIVYLREHG